MAAATGLSVANLYYNQPLLEELRHDFGVGVKEIGVIPTFTQLGYAVGMLFLVPLGDMVERRKLIVLTSLASMGALLLAAFSHSLLMMAIASLLIGLLTMTPQLIIPFAAHLADAKNRGRVLGIVVSGLLIGILLSRTLSGILGSWLGWRAVFEIAAVLMLILSAILKWALPTSTPHFSGSYVGLLKSIWKLVKEEPILREASLIGAMFFGVFSSLWATLIFLLSTHFNYGAREVGLFGLLGAAGAISAPAIGKIADRKHPRFGVFVCLLLTLLSIFIVNLSADSLIGLIIGIFIMDLGVQGGHVSNQTRIFALREDARSRINTVYMFCYFVGGALGSFLASLAWGKAEWTGVCVLELLFMVAAFVIFMRGRVQKTAT
jgi:predicted MFS family arabinose efflux permease